MAKKDKKSEAINEASETKDEFWNDETNSIGEISAEEKKALREQTIKELAERHGFSESDFARLKTEKRVNRRKRRNIAIIIILIITLLLAMWGIIYTLADQNSYRIYISGNRAASLSLSFDRDFKTGYSVLKCEGVEQVDKKDGSSYSLGISNYIQKVLDGTLEVTTTENGQKGKVDSAGTDEYMATKLYLKNLQEYTYEPLEYRVRITVQENTGNALNAARFMLICDTDGEKKQIVCATPSSDGSKEKVATTYQGSNTYVKDPYNNQEDWLCEKMRENTATTVYEYDTLTDSGYTLKINPGEAVGFVIAMWYEGSDPDHNDSILGNYITFSVTFETVEEE